jgi:hypothetical protein
MPKELENKLKQQISNKNWSEEKKNAYIYGTLRKTGWKPSTQKAFRGGLITKPRLAKRGY